VNHLTEPDRASPEAPATCIHNACRCFAAAKLAAMGRTLEATIVHTSTVTCIQGKPDAWSKGG